MKKILSLAVMMAFALTITAATAQEKPKDEGKTAKPGCCMQAAKATCENKDAEAKQAKCDPAACKQHADAKCDPAACKQHADGKGASGCKGHDKD